VGGLTGVVDDVRDRRFDVDSSKVESTDGFMIQLYTPICNGVQKFDD
jgi:hypothetical protein